MVPKPHRSRTGKVVGELAVLRGALRSASGGLRVLGASLGRSAVMAYVNDPAFDGAESATPLFEQHFGLPLVDAEQAFGIDDRPDVVDEAVGRTWDPDALQCTPKSPDGSNRQCNW